MLDRNGIEMKTGDVVRIDGAFFANDNGLYYVRHSPGDPGWTGRDHSLRKIGKRGKISKAKYSISFWPLCSFVSDYFKNQEARAWNKEHASIEVISGIDRSDIKAHFVDLAADMDVSLHRLEWDFGKDSEVYKSNVAIKDFLLKVAAGIN